MLWMWVTIGVAAIFTVLIWWLLRGAPAMKYPNWRNMEWEGYIVEIGGKKYRVLGNDKNSLLCIEMEDDAEGG